MESSDTLDFDDGKAPGKAIKSTRKKPYKRPACDSCKFRRVLCHPQNPPESCPRCVEKGIQCTTTPVVRKKPTGRTGKRIEEAKATFGTTNVPTPPAPVASSSKGSGSKDSTPPEIPLHCSPSQQQQLQQQQQLHQHQQQQQQQQQHQQTQQQIPINNTIYRSEALEHPLTISIMDRENLLGLAQLSGNLAAHLIELFQHTPDAFFPLPLLAHGKLSAQFESVGRRLESLPPDIEVLANVIMAFSSRISSHPLILGPGVDAPAYEDLDGSSILVPTIDLREFGRRRESMCVQFRDQAVRMIWERGAMVKGGEPNAASCHLLDVLEVREGIATSRPYGSAFICHIRAMADDTDPMTGISSLSNSGIHWSPFIMQEALVAESHLRAPLFTRGDQLSISGPSPSIDQALHQNVQGLDLREVMRLFYLPMQAFTHGVTNLARDAAENLVGTVARRSTLNEPYLTTWLANLDTLHSLLMLLQSRIGDQLSQTAVAAYALPPTAENERAFVLRACRFTLPIAYASLVSPVYREMERRMQIARIGSDESSRRHAERLKLLFSQVKRVAIRGARTIARCLLDIPTMAYITHLHFLKLDQWANILAEMSTVEEGGDGITGPQRVADLNLLIAGLRRSTFCWSHHNEVVDSLDMAQQLENLLQGYGSTPGASNHLNSRSSFPFNSQPIPQPLQPIVNQSAMGQQVPMIPSPHLQHTQLHHQHQQQQSQHQQQQHQQQLHLHQSPQSQTQNFLNTPFSSLMNEDLYYSLSGSLNAGVTPTGLVSTPEFSGGGGTWDNSGRSY